MTGVLSARPRSERSTSSPSRVGAPGGPGGRPRSSSTRSKRSLASVPCAAAAAENLRRLLDPASGVDIAFLQGGAGERARNQADADALVSLGSLFYEPVWLFYRQDSAKQRLKADTLSSLTQLAGWKVNVGARGSGS